MFTKEQIEEIRKKLSLTAKKDSQFPLTEIINNVDEVAILQNFENKRISIATLISHTENEIIPQFAELLDEAVEEIKQAIEDGSEKDVTLTVIPNTVGAKVSINDINTNTVTVKSGEIAVVRVYASGYRTFNEPINIHRTQTIYVTLDKETYSPSEKCTIRVVPTPYNATVTINGEVTNSLTVNYGEEVTIVVSANGYKTYSNIVTVTGDMTLNVELEKEASTTTYTLTINPTPSSATVRLNNQNRRSIEVEAGTSVHIKVSAPGYESYEDDYIVNRTETKNISLTPATIESYSNLRLTLSEGSTSVSAEGGTISCTASVNALYSNGETKIIDVTSEVDWEVEGEGCTSNNDGTFTWSANEGVSIREATIKGTYKDLSATVKTSQVGSEDYISLEPETLIFENNGETKQVSIYSNTSWTIL